MSNICPICNFPLLKKINFEGVVYSCISTMCNYSRMITKKNPVQILTTRVSCFAVDKLVSENYEIHISESLVRQGKTILEIHADGETTGVWKWYLGDLMRLCKYSRGQILSDRLYIDWGAKWSVTGMLKVYQEIINSIVLKGISV